MTNNALDLASLFKPILGRLAENREALNQADTYNHDHGDHMVEIFQVISEAMEEKRNAHPADQLAYASQLLRQRSNSGSAQLYSNGLAQAANQVRGQSQIDLASLIPLIQALLGSATSAENSPASSGGLLGSLLSGVLGGGSNSKSSQGIDLGGLLQLGMSLMQPGQEQPTETADSNSGLSALAEMLVGSSPMSQSPHRSQSSKLVIDALMQAVSSSIKQ